MVIVNLLNVFKFPGSGFMLFMSRKVGDLAVKVFPCRPDGQTPCQNLLVSVGMAVDANAELPSTFSNHD